jgi:S-adenosylmethionine hydrolase
MRFTTGLVTLTSDFGSADGYVGCMKGVILNIAPHAKIVDITHDLPPYDIRAAAWVLRTSHFYFPTDTLHLVVVDPGVGTSRRAILLLSELGIFIGPDNGVFSPVLSHGKKLAAYELTNKKLQLPETSSTFHGRDIFAPAAGHIVRGRNWADFGQELDITSLEKLPEPSLTSSATELKGEIVHIDRFGNLITNIPAGCLNAARAISVAGHSVGPLQSTYASAASGEPVALIGSHGFLEVGVRNGNAASFFSCETGKAVIVSLKKEALDAN